MSEDKKSLIDLVPDSIDNAVKNITDKPTQNIGTTLADIWYLVFGGISQAAEKRKLKYYYALQEFEKELEGKISKIPKDKLVEPDIQIVAPALEAAKYCIETKELRNMFSNIISKSLNKNALKYVHPLFTDILSHMRPIDAVLMTYIYNFGYRSPVILDIDNNKSILFSLRSLEYQNLIVLSFPPQDEEGYIVKIFSDLTYDLDTTPDKYDEPLPKVTVHITEFGRHFCRVCIGDTHPVPPKWEK